MHILIGIDDTDNKTSRGTGFHARQLAAALESKLGIVVHGITRHQQLIHPDVPYTSQNSSACLDVEANDFNTLKNFCRSHMINNQVPGSDIGLCMVEWAEITKEIISFAESVKKVVVTQQLARDLAAKNNIYLEGLCGTEDGVIGALAATGLRKSGEDGRFIWLNGSVKELRDLPEGIYTINELLRISGIQQIQNPQNTVIEYTDHILLNNWIRPVLKNNKAILLATKSKNNASYDWENATKDIVKKFSD